MTSDGDRRALSHERTFLIGLAEVCSGRGGGAPVALSVWSLGLPVQSEVRTGVVDQVQEACCQVWPLSSELPSGRSRALGRATLLATAAVPLVTDGELFRVHPFM